MVQQLEFLTPLYYSTMGYDPELIDYINFIDDSFLYDLLPEYKNHKLGRKPNNPVVMYRMHYLYFIKPEFIKFRQMVTELKKPKHQDYRNFIGVESINDIPSHSALSRFRAKLGLKEEDIEQIKTGDYLLTDFVSGIDVINKEIVKQSLKQEGFLNLMLGSVDSRPVKALVGGFKKECTCENTENCQCPTRFSDSDAKVGRQRMKVNQNKYFIGYRKNTLIVDSSEGPIPITSVVVDAKTSDQNVTIPIIQQVEKIDIKIPNIVFDMGYMDDESKVKAAETHKTIVHTEVKKNMKAPEFCDESGRLDCPEGNTMNVLEYVPETLEIIAGVTDSNKCSECFRYDTCDREFILSLKDNPHFYNPIPQKSELQKAFINYRKQSELYFAIESNNLSSKFCHSKLPVRSLKSVNVYMRLSDIFQITKKLISFCRKKYMDSDYLDKLSKMAENVIYQREYTVNLNNIAC